MKFKIILQLYLSHTVDEGENIFLKQGKGKPLLFHTLENLRRSFKSSDITAFAADHYLEDDRFRSVLDDFSIRCFPVKPGKITRQIADYIVSGDFDYGVRVIGNNPFIDGQIITDCLESLESSGFDYVSFDGAPKGMTPSEIVSRRILRRSMGNETFTRYLDRSKDNYILSYFKKQPVVPVLVHQCGFSEYSYLDLTIKTHSDLMNLGSWLGSKADLAALSRDSAGKVVMAHIEPTNQCNLDCLMCARLTRNSFGMLKFPDYKTILDKMAYLRRVNLNGDGEPFLNKDLPEMLEYAKQKGIMTRIITNATIPTREERLEKVMSNLDFFNISLDGASKRSFETIRIKSDFEKTLDIIRQITGVVKKNSLQLDEFWINCVIQKENYTEILDMVRVVANVGVPALNFKLMNTNYDRGDDQFKFDDSNRLVQERMDTHMFSDSAWVSDRIAEAQELGNQLGVQVFYEQDIDKNFSYHSCGLSQKVFITYDGWVTPCCLRPEPKVFNFGNLLTEDYNDIFGAPRYRAFVRGLIREEPSSLCLRCPSLETQGRRQESA